MDTETLKSVDTMTWLIAAVAAVICSAVLFNKAIRFMLKLAVIAVLALIVGYFLVQSGVIELPIRGQ